MTWATLLLGHVLLLLVIFPAQLPPADQTNNLHLQLQSSTGRIQTGLAIPVLLDCYSQCPRWGPYHGGLEIDWAGPLYFYMKVPATTAAQKWIKIDKQIEKKCMNFVVHWQNQIENDFDIWYNYNERWVDFRCDNPAPRIPLFVRPEENIWNIYINISWLCVQYTKYTGYLFFSALVVGHCNACSDELGISDSL